MLVVERRPGTGLRIGKDIHVSVRWIRHRRAVRLGIEAPPDVPIVRDELVEQLGDPASPVDASDAAARALKVVLIEDDPGHAELIRLAMEESGVDQMHHFDRAEPALEAMTNSHDAPLKPGLIVMDLRLPDVRGVELITRLRAAPRLRRVPVVVLSCDEALANVEACLDAGANAFVRKEPQADAFTAAVARIVEFWSHSQAG